MDCRVRTEREARRQWRGSRRRLDDGIYECNPKGKITPTPRGARDVADGTRAILTCSKRTWLLAFSLALPLDHFC